MLDSLPALRKQLEKIERSEKLNPQSKIEKYQKKILQLLIREKTTILQNQQLQKQLANINKKLSETDKTSKNLVKSVRQKQSEVQKLKSEIQRLTQAYENLETQNRMNQIGRLNQEEKYSELAQQFSQLQKSKEQLQGELKNAMKQSNSLKKEMTDTSNFHQVQMQQLNQKINALIRQAESSRKKYQNQLTELHDALQSKDKDISQLKHQLSKLQQKLVQSTSSETSLKQRLNELIESSSQSQSKVNELGKQLHILKLKNKQFQESLYSTEIEKGEQSLEFTKLDKDNKKLKKQLSSLQERIKEVQDEKSSLQDKCEQVTKNFKNAKKELQKIKDSLSQANDFESGVKFKIDKLELSVKQYRQLLQQKDQKCRTLEESIKKVEKDLENYKNETIQAKFNLEETRKKYDVVSEARNLAQQKLVLQREENSKSLSSMIKEKDVCYRQNYKLLQLLELKDKTLENILNGLKTSSDLQKDLSLQISAKENNTKRIISEIMQKDIKGHKERVKLIDEQLQKYKV